MKNFGELYSSCWQAWQDDGVVSPRFHDRLTRRRTQWRTMGDFMWAAFCMQWVVVSWCAVVGKESAEILPRDEAKEREVA